MGSKTRRPRECEVCGETYRPSYFAQRTCGRKCGGELRNKPDYVPTVQRDTALFLRSSPESTEITWQNCEVCGRQFPHRASQPRRQCGNHDYKQVRKLFYGAKPSSAARGYGAAWRKVREQVLQRDRYTCNYCGDLADSVDHIVPKVMGGTDDLANLVAACMGCNSSKAGRSAPRPRWIEGSSRRW